MQLMYNASDMGINAYIIINANENRKRELES